MTMPGAGSAIEAAMRMEIAATRLKIVCVSTPDNFAKWRDEARRLHVEVGVDAVAAIEAVVARASAGEDPP